jgi:hypothetical protein
MTHPITTKFVTGKQDSYTYVGSFPASDLPSVIIGQHEATPIALRCSKVTMGMKSSDRLIKPTLQGQPNPRTSGKMTWTLVDAAQMKQAQDTKWIVLKETLFCNKGKFCMAFKGKNKRQACGFKVRWVVSLDDLQACHVFMRGSHRARWWINGGSMKMAPQVKTKILKADGLDCGMGGRTTAM